VTSFNELTVTYEVERSPDLAARRVAGALDDEFTAVDLDPDRYGSARDGREPWEDADYVLPFVAHDDEIAYVYLHTHDDRSFFFFETALVQLAGHLDLTGDVVRFRSSEAESWGWADVFSAGDGAVTHEREVSYDEDRGTFGARAIGELVDAGHRLATYRDLKRPSFRIHTPENPSLD
jgi:hypothetical protein